MVTTLEVLRGTIEDLIRFQSLLVLFAQQITPTSTRAIATSPGCCAACPVPSTRLPTS
jgi:hypothetical protein